MTYAILGNHSALRVDHSEREQVRAFYCDVLGGTLVRSFDNKDDIRLGNDFYIAFLYAAGDGKGADKGVNHAAEHALAREDFHKAIWLEIKSDNVDAMRRRIVESGVTVLDVPDPHLYFQAPGGQIFRLAGIGEDMSRYETTN